ncbi:MAG: hypothetical protein Q4G58_07615 [bacterium]|nr:hypothetical protein [bacterium]
MLFTEEIYFKNDFYTVLLREADNLLMEVVREHKPIWKSYSGDVIASYDLQDYMLTLQDLILDKHLMKRNEKFCDREPIIDMVTGNKVFDKLNCPVKYTGNIIVAKDLIDTFSLEENLSEYPCYCYKEVYELCFDQGCLTMSIDHSKAMVRIRKNIEKGLRNTKNAKDVRCINKFLKQTFCHDFEKNRKLRTIKNKVYKVKHKLHNEE